jgi:hypothetical protein
VNELARKVLDGWQARQKLDVPSAWTLVGGVIALPPKITPEQWIERQGSDQGEGDVEAGGRGVLRE